MLSESETEGEGGKERRDTEEQKRDGDEEKRKDLSEGMKMRRENLLGPPFPTNSMSTDVAKTQQPIM